MLQPEPPRHRLAGRVVDRDRDGRCAQPAADLAGFQGRYSYLAYNLNEYYIDGTPSALDFEGTMDVEWATAMANSYGSYLDTAHVYLYSGVNPQFTTFHDMYNSMLTNNTAKIVSSSWGCAEFYCIGDAQMNTDHSIYDSMVAQGFTMVNSSGDRGAYADCVHVSVSNPAADPDWLAIGGTNLELAAGPVYQSETGLGRHRQLLRQRRRHRRWLLREVRGAVVAEQHLRLLRQRVARDAGHLAQR